MSDIIWGYSIPVGNFEQGVSFLPILFPSLVTQHSSLIARPLLCYNFAMRVALNGYFWDQPRTGSGQYLHHLWSALNQSPYNKHDSYSLLRPGIEAQTSDRVSGGVSPEGSGSKVQKLIWEQKGVALGAQRVRAHVLHIPYLSAPLVQPCRTVVTAHDVIPWVVPGYQVTFKMRLYLALSVAGVKRARFVLADSEASRRDAIKALGLKPHKVHTVYLGMEAHPEYSPEQLDEIRARYGLPAHYAFYLGGFDRRKNVPLLLRAWRGALSELEGEWCDTREEKPLLAIGGAVPKPEGIFPDVKGEAASLGWDAPNAPVRFLGRIPEEDKPLLMAAARLFVYPSAYEGFGLDPLEAMSVGCPVVSSSGGSLAEVVGEGGILVPPSHEKAFSQAVVRAWTDPALRAKLSHG
ncbi:MAG: glycosyltransferase family 1 protein, partial [Chloroflexia bacterium]